jgi:two-component sensor histidine kinase
MDKQANYFGYVSGEVQKLTHDSFDKRSEIKSAEELEGVLPSLAYGVSLLGEQLKHKVEELNEITAELSARRNLMVTVMEVVPSMIFVLDQSKNEINFVNKCTSVDERYPCAAAILEVDKPCVLCKKPEAFSQTMVRHYLSDSGKEEVKVRCSAGRKQWFMVSKDKFQSSDNPNSTNVLYSLTDITSIKIKEHELIRNEIVISNSLKEKALLLQEIHHRVKNNLQIIYGLLGMQSNRSQSAEVKENLLEIQKRIYSIALVHEELYRSENFLTIDVAKYCKKLCDSLGNINGHEKQVLYEFDLQDGILITIDQATPLGLFLNEVLVNAYKHAFKNSDKQGVISVKLSSTTDEFVLEVKDNGPGLIEDTNLTSGKEKLGSKLIKGLSQQLKGVLEKESKEGVLVRLTVPNKVIEKAKNSEKKIY